MAVAIDATQTLDVIKQRLGQARDWVQDAIALVGKAQEVEARYAKDMTMTYPEYFRLIQDFLDSAELKAADAQKLLDPTDGTYEDINFNYRIVVKPGRASLTEIEADNLDGKFYADDSVSFSSFAVDDYIYVDSPGAAANNGEYAVTAKTGNSLTTSPAPGDAAGSANVTITLLKRDI